MASNDNFFRYFWKQCSSITDWQKYPLKKKQYRNYGEKLSIQHCINSSLFNTKNNQKIHHLLQPLMLFSAFKTEYKMRTSQRYLKKMSFCFENLKKFT